MDLTVLVQNIKMRCKAIGISPSKAAKDSGAGEALITSIERKGSVPSIEKVQQLATYLGCTVSDLLGEKKEPTTVSDDGPSASELIFRALPPAKQEEALRYMRFLAEQEDK